MDKLSAIGYGVRGKVCRRPVFHSSATTTAYPVKGGAYMELFDAKGIDYPENLTWNEYLDLIKELTGEDA
mgnify:CR=1 FL=1